MAGISLMDNGKRNCNDQVEFQLSADDSYDVRCGEVFITLNRVLVFQCSLCDSKYASSDYFLEHLSTQHNEKMYYEITEINTGRAKCETGTKDDLDDYNFEELCQETIYDENYESHMDEDFTVDDIKPELIEIGEEHLEDNGNILQLEESLLEYDDLQSSDPIKVEVETSVKQRDLDKSSQLPKSKYKKSDIIQCDQCKKVFVTKQKLTKHIAIHSSERRHKCKICGFAFKERSNLNAHMRRHTGQKKISCKMCPKKFFTRTESETHMRTHTGERPFICSYCGMAFTTSGGLSEHVKRHNNVRPHKCNLCDKRFYDSCQLKDHMPVHTNERPYVCTVCSANFARRKSLLVHTKLHINAKEYECSLCEKSFNQKPALIAHMRINHKVMDASKISEFS